jgi:hypothetical protein
MVRLEGVTEPEDESDTGDGGQGWSHGDAKSMRFP